jgi:hypothetical protein
MNYELGIMSYEFKYLFAERFQSILGEKTLDLGFMPEVKDLSIDRVINFSASLRS